MFFYKKTPLFLSLLVSLLCINCNNTLKEVNVDEALEKEISIEVKRMFEEVVIPLSVFQKKGGNIENVINLFEHSSIVPRDFLEIGIDYESLLKKSQNLSSLLEQLTYSEDEDIILKHLTDLSVTSILSSKTLSVPINIRAAGTPCYDSFEIDTYAASVFYGTCLFTSGYTPPGMAFCTVLFASSILVAEYNYDSCMAQYIFE